MVFTAQTVTLELDIRPQNAFRHSVVSRHAQWGNGFDQTRCSDAMSQPYQISSAVSAMDLHWPRPWPWQGLVYTTCKDHR